MKHGWWLVLSLKCGLKTSADPCASQLGNRNSFKTYMMTHLHPRLPVGLLSHVWLFRLSPKHFSWFSRYWFSIYLPYQLISPPPFVFHFSKSLCQREFYPISSCWAFWWSQLYNKSNWKTTNPFWPSHLSFLVVHQPLYLLSFSFQLHLGMALPILICQTSMKWTRGKSNHLLNFSRDLLMGKFEAEFSHA